MSTTAVNRPRVALFVTCMVDTLYPEVGMASVRLLEQHGATVVFPEAQTCCGQPAFNAGSRKEAKAIAMKFLDVFWPLVNSGEIDAVVAPSGSCVAMVKHFYGVLFENSKNDKQLKRARQVAAATYELTQYLVDVLNVREPCTPFDGKLTYHPCCHLYRELGIDEQPRALLSAACKSELRELPEGQECCGFGGLFAIKNAEISTAMGRRKTANVAASGADTVVLNDVSCMTHLNGIFKHEGSSCRAVHIADVLTARQSNTDATDGEAT